MVVLILSSNQRLTGIFGFGGQNFEFDLILPGLDPPLASMATFRDNKQAL